MTHLILLFLLLAAFDAAFFYCAFEKWTKIQFQSRCRYCIAFWGCVLQVIGFIVTYWILRGSLPLPWYELLLLPFALQATAAICYFYIKQAFQ